VSSPSAGPHFLSLPDLAGRPAGGAVLWANDDLFAECENLIKPGPAEHRPATFGHKGQVYDGWETRRRRGATPDAHDSAIIRLGVPGIVRGVVVDTAWFTGNYPPQISVEAAYVAGYPTVEELVDKAQWTTIVERSDVNGDTRNPFKVDSSRRWSHVRLSIYPDGGVARFRVHGEGLLDPRFADGLPLDLAALENGGRITACSNMFYSSPNNLLLPVAAPRRRKRLGASPLGQPRSDHHGRVGHVIFHRQRARLGTVVRARR
jgi:allantoicase